MDKHPLDELKDDIRRTLQALNDNLLELNDYLARLRAETVVEINAAMAVEGTPSDEELTALMRARKVLMDAPTVIDDARRPYQNQRQPRRDGDSFGSLLPLKQMEGGYYGTKTEERGD